MTWITLFDILWLTSLLVLLLLIWRSSERRRKEDKERDIKYTNALIEMARKDAESARNAVAIVQEVITLLHAEKPEPPDVL